MNSNLARRSFSCLMVLGFGLLWGCGTATNESTTSSETTEVPAENAKSNASSVEETPVAVMPDEPEEPPRLPDPEGAKPMPKPYRVWVDADRHLVIVDGYLSLREGMLEMFACPIGTKEHESIVAVYSSAQVVHAALLAVGAEVGQPVRFQPEYHPPEGTEIAIEVRWLDESEKWQSMPAQQWVRDLRTEKPMKHPWVFAGSGFWKDEETGEEYYLAETGDFICVSNFSTATLDIPVESSQVNDGLLFEANTGILPPLGTPVRLVLTPKLEKED